MELKCPKCGLIIESLQMKCPRCNTSLKDQLSCDGDCNNCSKH